MCLEGGTGWEWAVDFLSFSSLVDLTQKKGEPGKNL